MIRAILYLVISIFLLTFIRMVVGLLMKTMREMMSSPTTPNAPPGRPPSAPVAGELKRDPVCGTFVPANSSFQKTINGSSFCFCSAACRDKYAG
jgi:YHS domain-containing protein